MLHDTSWYKKLTIKKVSITPIANFLQAATGSAKIFSLLNTERIYDIAEPRKGL